MSRLVVDASVGLKWCLDEPHARVARSLLGGSEELSVPRLFFVEIASALAKRQRRGEFPGAVVLASLEAIETVPLAVWPDRLLFWDAVTLALRHGCSVYDSLYVALAERIDGRVVTADRRLVNLLTGTEAAGRVAPIEEWVEPPA